MSIYKYKNESGDEIRVRQAGGGEMLFEVTYSNSNHSTDVIQRCTSCKDAIKSAEECSLILDFIDQIKNIHNKGDKPEGIPEKEWEEIQRVREIPRRTWIGLMFYFFDGVVIEERWFFGGPKKHNEEAKS